MSKTARIPATISSSMDQDDFITKATQLLSDSGNMGQQSAERYYVYGPQDSVDGFSKMAASDDVEYRGYFVCPKAVGKNKGVDTWTWSVFTPNGELAYDSKWSYERREDALDDAYSKVNDLLDHTFSYEASRRTAQETPVGDDPRRAALRQSLEGENKAIYDYQNWTN